MSKKPKKYRPQKDDMILVEWMDAATHAKWVDVGKETDEVTCTGCKTAGFFVGNKAGSFKIALSISEDENYGDVLAIPTKQILAIYKLTVNNNNG